MGEEVEISDYANRGCSRAGVEDRVSEWEVGLPNADELTHLSHSLIPTELAFAFRISPEPTRSMLDVNQASQNTFSSLLAGGKGGGGQALTASNKFKSFHDETACSTMTDNLDMDVDDADLAREGSDSRKTRRAAEGGSIGEADYVIATTNNESSNWNENGGDDGSARTLKRPRLVWTAELHKRFVEVVAHLGIKNAVPKTIMQLMNVEGLTRENVASHLQKYRLYVKRMEGQSTEDSPSDHLFSSTPVPRSLHESDGGSGQVNGSGHIAIPFPMPYPPPAAHMIPVPVIRMPGSTPGSFYDSHHRQNHHQYGMVQQQMDWSGYNFGSVAPYNHYYPVAPSDK